MTKIAFKRRAKSLSLRKLGRGKRAGFAVLATAGVLGSVGLASPAQAAPTAAFEIFYGQDCSGGGTASRIYVGPNAGEDWINDTFNLDRFGSAGYGQKVLNNAASIYVSHADVAISTDGGFSYAGHYRSVDGACFNFASNVRNNNDHFAIGIYGNQ